jgi:hypothetical protein
MKAKHGILNKDTYNFDETRFIIDVILTKVVVTASNCRGQQKSVQQSNRE